MFACACADVFPACACADLLPACACIDVSPVVMYSLQSLPDSLQTLPYRLACVSSAYLLTYKYPFMYMPHRVYASPCLFAYPCMASPCLFAYACMHAYPRSLSPRQISAHSNLRVCAVPPRCVCVGGGVLMCVCVTDEPQRARREAIQHRLRFSV